jgi:hypothetical protein
MNRMVRQAMTIRKQTQNTECSRTSNPLAALERISTESNSFTIPPMRNESIISNEATYDRRGLLSSRRHCRHGPLQQMEDCIFRILSNDKDNGRSITRGGQSIPR